jgi:cell division GTPase FtsZ
MLQVIGVGGGGGNAINRIIESEVQVSCGDLGACASAAGLPVVSATVALLWQASTAMQKLHKRMLL